MVQPRASPSGRAWLITTNRCRERMTSAISSRAWLLCIGICVVVWSDFRLVRRDLDLAEDIDHAGAALNGFIELEVQLRRVFQHHALGEEMLQMLAFVVQPGHGPPGLLVA